MLSHGSKILWNIIDLEKGKPMPKASLLTSGTEGLAALSICESILIALGDLKIMSLQDTRDILTDAAQAHRSAGEDADQVKKHEAIASVIERIRTSANSVHI